MKDIKSLHRQAKFGSQADRASYAEAVTTLLGSPTDYLANLEYIISSSVGLDTFHQFRERYHLPICGYRRLMEITDELIGKANIHGVNEDGYLNLYDEAYRYLEDHEHLVAMYEAYEAELPSTYLNTYYRRIGSNDIQMEYVLTSLGPAALPDIILEASQADIIGEVITYLSESSMFSDPTMRQWLVEVFNDVGYSAEFESVISQWKTESLEGIVESVKSRRMELYRESMIFDEPRYVEYSEVELSAIDELIRFKEYMVTALQSEDSQLDAQRSAYEAYEELDGLIPEEETSSDMAELLPGNRVTERVTSHQKHGRIPGYLANKHDMSYGEDEPPKNDGSEEDDTELNVDDYRRSKGSPEPSDTDVSEPAGDMDDGSISKPSPSDPKGVQNYYYYNYLNSTHQQNTDSSTGKNIHDQSVRYKADQSTNTNSKNRLSGSPHKFESAPWKLDIPINDSIYLTEGSNKDKEKIEELTIAEFKKNIDKVSMKTKEDDNRPYTREPKDFLSAIGKFIRERKKQFRIKETNFTPEMKEICDLAVDELTSKFKNIRDDIADGKIKVLGGKWTINRCLQQLNNYKYRGTVRGDLSKSPKYLILSNLMSFNESAYHIQKRIISALEDVSDMLGNRFDNNAYLHILMVTTSNYVNGVWVGDTISYYISVGIKGPMAEELFESKRSGKSFTEEVIWLEDDDFSDLLLEGDYFIERKKDTDPNEPEKPTSDHPVRDALQDVDRVLTRKGAEAKRKANNIVNTGKAIAKPVQRTKGWITNMVDRWKDSDMNNIKSKMTDPRSRHELFNVIKKTLAAGALYKAGILMNPLFLALAATKKLHMKKNEARIRSDIIGELKAEVEIIDAKIEDAARNGDNAAKYKLMRLKNEMQKKLVRVGGSKSFSKII